MALALGAARVRRGPLWYPTDDVEGPTIAGEASTLPAAALPGVLGLDERNVDCRLALRAAGAAEGELNIF